MGACSSHSAWRASAYAPKEGGAESTTAVVAHTPSLTHTHANTHPRSGTAPGTKYRAPDGPTPPSDASSTAAPSVPMYGLAALPLPQPGRPLRSAHESTDALTQAHTHTPTSTHGQGQSRVSSQGPPSALPLRTAWNVHDSNDMWGREMPHAMPATAGRSVSDLRDVARLYALPDDSVTKLTDMQAQVDSHCGLPCCADAQRARILGMPYLCASLEAGDLGTIDFISPALRYTFVNSSRCPRAGESVFNWLPEAQHAKLRVAMEQAVTRARSADTAAAHQMRECDVACQVPPDVTESGGTPNGDVAGLVSLVLPVGRKADSAGHAGHAGPRNFVPRTRFQRILRVRWRVCMAHLASPTTFKLRACCEVVDVTMHSEYRSLCKEAQLLASKLESNIEITRSLLHDARGMLGNAMGAASELQRRGEASPAFGSRPNTTAAAHVDTAEDINTLTSAHTMMEKLLTNAIEFQRVGDNRQPPKKEPTAILSNLFDMFNQSRAHCASSGKHLHLGWYIDPALCASGGGVPASIGAEQLRRRAVAATSVYADALLLQRGLNNYISNALKFSPPGAAVQVQFLLLSAALFTECTQHADSPSHAGDAPPSPFSPSATSQAARFYYDPSCAPAMVADAPIRNMLRAMAAALPLGGMFGGSAPAGVAVLPELDSDNDIPGLVRDDSQGPTFTIATVDSRNAHTPDKLPPQTSPLWETDSAHGAWTNTSPEHALPAAGSNTWRPVPAPPDVEQLSRTSMVGVVSSIVKHHGISAVSSLLKRAAVKPPQQPVVALPSGVMHASSTASADGVLHAGSVSRTAHGGTSAHMPHSAGGTTTSKLDSFDGATSAASDMSPQEQEGWAWLVVSVTDRGPGMSEEEQRALFKPYSQIRPMKTQGGKGSGLGLLIVRESVRSHGGDVGCISAPGEGSTFYFMVPVQLVHTTTTTGVAAPFTAMHTSAGGARTLLDTGRSDGPHAESMAHVTMSPPSAALRMLSMNPSSGRNTSTGVTQQSSRTGFTTTGVTEALDPTVVSYESPDQRRRELPTLDIVHGSVSAASALASSAPTVDTTGVAIESASPTRRIPCRLLLVDDDPVWLRLVQRAAATLRSSEHPEVQMTCAISATEALIAILKAAGKTVSVDTLSLWRRSRNSADLPQLSPLEVDAVNAAFHTIVTDMSLEDGSGADLLAAITWWNLRCRVIVVTGDSDASVHQRLLQLGAMRVLVKGQVKPADVIRAAITTH